VKERRDGRGEERPGRGGEAEGKRRGNLAPTVISKSRRLCRYLAGTKKITTSVHETLREKIRCSAATVRFIPQHPFYSHQPLWK